MCLHILNVMSLFISIKLCVFRCIMRFRYCIHQVVCFHFLNLVPVFTYTKLYVFRFGVWCRCLHATSCVFSDFECRSGIYIHHLLCLQILKLMLIYAYTNLCVLRFWMWFRHLYHTNLCVFWFWRWCRYIHRPTCVSSNFEYGSGIYIYQTVFLQILSVMPIITYT